MNILMIAPNNGSYDWIKDLLQSQVLHHQVACVYTEKDASQRIYDIDAGRLACDLIILCEFWLPTMTIEELIALDEAEIESIGDAMGSGVRLCQLARKLGLKTKFYATSTLIGQTEEEVRVQAQATGVRYIYVTDFRKVMNNVYDFIGRCS